MNLLVAATLEGEDVVATLEDAHEGARIGDQGCFAIHAKSLYEEFASMQARLIRGPGFITNDLWLARYLATPINWDLWEPPQHARQLVADADAGMTSRELAQKYGYAHGNSARAMVRKWRRRLNR